MSKRKYETLTSIELGTASIKVLMGNFLPDAVLNIIGFAERPSLKIMKGEILDANLVHEQLVLALSEAEKMAGAEIGHVFLGITGNSIRAVNSVGSTLIHAGDNRVSEDDLVKALDNAKGYGLPPDKRVLHHLDRRYLVDGGREVLNPIGQVGGKLEADIQIIYGHHNSIETACRIVRDVMGYPATDIAFSGVAAGLGTYSSAQMAQGSLVIDIGAGMTEYVLFHGSGAFHAGQVGVGCDHAVNDLALGLRLPVPRCRTVLQELEKFEASVLMRPDGHKRIMEVETLTQQIRTIPISSIEQILELRFREIMQLIYHDLRNKNALSRIANEIMITGGGALIPGIDELTRDVFQMPARCAVPYQLNGAWEVVASPRFVVPAGLLRWGKMSLEIGDTEPSFLEQLAQDGTRFIALFKNAFKW